MRLELGVMWRVLGDALLRIVNVVLSGAGEDLNVFCVKSAQA